MDPQAKQSVQQQIVDQLLKNQKILIMASSPADGDCIGSSLSLYLALKKLNKEVTVVCPDPIPDLYHFLPNTHVIGDRVVASKDFIITIDTRKIQNANIKNLTEDGKINIIIMPENGRLSDADVSFNYGPERYDIIITVDTGGLEQLGQLHAGNIEMFSQMPVINIDHHFSNDHFGRINYVDVMASATTELLIPVIDLLEQASKTPLWDEDIATLLLTGIITDTGSFQNANTTPRAFDASAQLIAHGARQQEIIQHIFKTKQLTTLKLWGRILTKMQTDDRFHIVWSVLTRKDFSDTGAAENETGGIVDELLSNAPGAEIICLLKEKKDGLVSGSIRTTNPSIDASSLAENFGGGGHARAAGFKITDVPVEKVEQQVLKLFREYQSKRLGVPLDGEPVLSHPPVAPSKPLVSPSQSTPSVTSSKIPSSSSQKSPPFTSSPKQKMENTPVTSAPVPASVPAPVAVPVAPQPTPAPVAPADVSPKLDLPLQAKPVVAPAPTSVPVVAPPPAPVMAPPQASQAPTPVVPAASASAEASSSFNFQTLPQVADTTAQGETQPTEVAPYRFEK
jgi:phosphoesterase RecJ-like protein